MAEGFDARNYAPDSDDSTESEVHGQLAHAENLAEIISTRVATLDQRLTAVLADVEMSATEAPTMVAPSLVPLAHQIRNHGERLENIVHRLEDLIARIRV